MSATADEESFTASKVFNSITNSIGAALKDLTELTIVTTTGRITKVPAKIKGVNDAKEDKDAYLVVEETAISAKTIIQIDGDIITRIPVIDEEGKPIKIDERMLKLHEKNVEMAMKNWQVVISTLVETLKVLDAFG